MPPDIHAAIEWLGKLLDGPFGGLVGGALSFLALEMGIKRLRERRELADAVAAELADNADVIQAVLDDADRETLPLYYGTSDTVFRALVGRLGALPYRDIVPLAKLYRMLGEYNRMPAVWTDRARSAFDLPHNHPHREAELPALKEAADDFYRHLATLGHECHSLAAHLRTKHGLGWRRLIPLRFRPNAPVSRELPPGR